MTTNRERIEQLLAVQGELIALSQPDLAEQLEATKKAYEDLAGLTLQLASMADKGDALVNGLRETLQ